jgi:hypothetical protein
VLDTAKVLKVMQAVAVRTTHFALQFAARRMLSSVAMEMIL